MASHERFRETSLKINMLQRRPALRETISPDRHRIDHFYIRIQREVPVHRLFEVQEYGCLCFGERITLNTATFSRGQLDINIVIFQQHTVIARHGILFLVREPRLLTVLVHGEHEDVDEIRSTRPAQPRMRKAENSLVVIVISRSLPPSPALRGYPAKAAPSRKGYGGTRIICFPLRLCATAPVPIKGST